MNYSSPHIISAFDPVVEHFSEISTSFSENEALKENFWDIGEDACLREDFRFRQMPGGLWIIAESLLANDELRKLFTQKVFSANQYYWYFFDLLKDTSEMWGA